MLLAAAAELPVAVTTFLNALLNERPKESSVPCWGKKLGSLDFVIACSVPGERRRGKSTRAHPFVFSTKRAPFPTPPPNWHPQKYTKQSCRLSVERTLLKQEQNAQSKWKLRRNEERKEEANDGTTTNLVKSDSGRRRADVLAVEGRSKHAGCNHELSPRSPCLPRRDDSGRSGGSSAVRPSVGGSEGGPRRSWFYARRAFDLTESGH
ncbi:hypothetical protein MRX96_010810 [Rhipicephalus microplus]